LPKRRIVIIGRGIAGLTAANSSRKVDEKADITILSTEKHQPYCKPSLACVVRGTASLPEEIGIYPNEILESKKIRLLPSFEAYEIDPKERVVKARKTGTNETVQLDYDTSVLAVGGHDLVPQIEGTNLKGIYTLQTFDDALKISETAKSGRGIIVVGAGPIALSIAEALLKRGIKTTMVVRSRILRTLIEPDLSLYVQKRIESEGVTCLFDAEIEKILGRKSVEGMQVSGEKIPASMIIFATGIRASTKLAEETGIKVGKYGIQVNEHMRTSERSIFSAGDCTETIDFITRNRTYLPIGSIAAQEGTIAGANAAGMEMRTDGFLRVQADNLFGMEITSIGHSSETAQALGIEVDVLEMKSSRRIKNPYGWADKYQTRVKIITDKKRKIVGAQALGRRMAAQERYVLFKAIEKKMEERNFVRLPKTGKELLQES